MLFRSIPINLYSMGMALERAEAETDIARKAAAYRMPGAAVDGMDVVAVESAARHAVEEIRAGGGPQFLVALIEFRGDGGASHDQSRDEGAEESFAPAPGVVHELEEAEIQRQLLLRDTPVWPQPGT